MNFNNLSHKLLILFIGVSFLSCGDDNEECPRGYSGSDCEIYCSQDILGTWSVTEIKPVGCTLLSYEFALGSRDNILKLTLDDGDRILTGDGLLDDGCSEMTYTVSSGGTIVSGKIVFTGDMLEDQSGLGCLISATKQ